jgi:hypothetical protein
MSTTTGAIQIPQARKSWRSVNPKRAAVLALITTAIAAVISACREPCKTGSLAGELDEKKVLTCERWLRPPAVSLAGFTRLDFGRAVATAIDRNHRLEASASFAQTTNLSPGAMVGIESGPRAGIDGTSSLTLLIPRWPRCSRIVSSSSAFGSSFVGAW